MNPYTGATYTLGRDLLDSASPEEGEPGAVVWPSSLLFAAEQVGRELTDDEQAALDDEGPLVCVSGEVAQAVQLGTRERDRRKRRRKQARESRRRNR